MYVRYWKWEVNGNLRGVFRLTSGRFQQCRNLQWKQSDYLERASQDPEFIEVDEVEAARLCGELVMHAELGMNPLNWPTNSLIERPALLIQAFEQLHKAVEIAMAKPKEAKRLIASIDNNYLKQWYMTVALTSGKWRERHLSVHRSPRQHLRSNEGFSQRKVSEVEIEQIMRRDHWTCRYCHSPVAGRRGSFKKFAEQIDFSELITGRTDQLRNGIYLVFSASFDHVIPRSAGGSNDLENLVTACWPCQFGKGDNSLESLGLSDPRLRPPSQVEGWRGIWPY